jgi:hypothetical protein
VKLPPVWGSKFTTPVILVGVEKSAPFVPIPPHQRCHVPASQEHGRCRPGMSHVAATPPSLKLPGMLDEPVGSLPLYLGKQLHQPVVPLDSAASHQVVKRNRLRQILWCTIGVPTAAVRRLQGLVQMVEGQDQTIPEPERIRWCAWQ